MKKITQVTGEFPAQKASNAENIPFDDVIMKEDNIHHNKTQCLEIMPIVTTGPIRYIFVCVCVCVSVCACVFGVYKYSSICVNNTLPYLKIAMKTLTWKYNKLLCIEWLIT